MPDGTCRFIVFDFDNHEKGAEAADFANTDNEWHKEVDALRKMCELNGIKPLVERSRSGKGAHVWIFFQKAIPAVNAFGKTVVCSYLISERKVNTLILYKARIYSIV